MTDFERARAYVAQMPAAISGSGGHDATFAVAKALIHDFALPQPQAWQILSEYNERCSPPWNARELQHKMKSATNLTRASRRRGVLSKKGYNIYRDPRVYQQIPARPPIHIPDFEPRVWGRITVDETPAPAPAPEKPAHDEAKRVAGELVKLHRAGAIADDSDPEARFYAHVIHLFGGTYEGRKGHDMSDTPLLASSARRLSLLTTCQQRPLQVGKLARFKQS
jgi:hypothetical protein